jgi:16S rRNA (cytidine1402-2'-O)-methyltransferase
VGARGKLYVVATPIGNLEDLSPRAVATLENVDLIAAEDTRVTRRLMARAGVSGDLISYREETEESLTPRLVAKLLDGKNVALVSDAGTPTISDPGYRLVKAAAEAGVDVIGIPGPCAVTTLLSIAGLPTDRFAFEGFLPNARKARRDALAAMAGAGRTVVLYESPRRVVALLDEIAELLGNPDVAVGRELTKVFEEVLRGSASEVAAMIGEKKARGEFVVAMYLPARPVATMSDAEIEEEIRRLLEQGASVKDAAQSLKARGVSRRRVYEVARTLK